MTSNPQAVTHAAWCSGAPICYSGLECYRSAGDVAAEHQTLSSGATTYLGVSLARLLEPEYRTTAMAADETCVISLGVGLRGYMADDWAELTPSEARVVAAELLATADLADEDARLHGSAVTG